MQVQSQQRQLRSALSKEQYKWNNAESMDQEAEAMKTKKMLWPWAKRMVMGETKASRRHTAGSENTDSGFRDDTEPFL